MLRHVLARGYTAAAAEIQARTRAALVSPQRGAAIGLFWGADFIGEPWIARLIVLVHDAYTFSQRVSGQRGGLRQ